LLLAGCGVTRSQSSGSGSNHGAACAYVAKLDEIADGVSRADVHDPDAFKKTLDDAVQDYVTNVKSLQAVAPASLHPSLDRVESDVQQYRFDAARADRADLDAYAARTCGRNSPAAPSTTAGPNATIGPNTTAGLNTTGEPTTSGSVPITSTSVEGGPGSSGVTSGG
jgi:hypothetical protein